MEAGPSQAQPSIPNVKRFLKYLSLSTRKFYAENDYKMEEKLFELEKKNEMLSDKLYEMERKLKPKVFSKSTLRSKQEIMDEITKITKKEKPKLEEQYFPPELFSKPKKLKKFELENKIEKKLGSTETEEKEIHSRLSQLSNEAREKRRKLLEKRIDKKLLDEKFNPIRGKISIIKKEYNRLRRLKKYKNKKRKLAKLKKAIDSLSNKIESYY